MKQLWFKKAGTLYFPVHPMGYAVTLLAVIFMIAVTRAVIRNGHSVSDDLYQMFIYGTCPVFWGNRSQIKQVVTSCSRMVAYQP